MIRNIIPHSRGKPSALHVRGFPQNRGPTVFIGPWCTNLSAEAVFHSGDPAAGSMDGRGEDDLYSHRAKARAPDGAVREA